jgi:hypothetical protein
MEFLDGETLAHRLRRGKLPLAQVLQYGIQIASGLAAAHQAGIVHRDVKPGNVMLTKHGAMLLDFGLAWAPHEEVDASSSTWSVAPATHRTAAGTIGYMAPEQANGGQGDSRSDIFAFGAVLYEMVSGVRAFRGDSPQAVLDAIRTSQPEPLPTINKAIPASLDRVIRICLEKAPERRWQSASDVARQLEGTLADESTPPTSVRGARWPARWLVLAGACSLAAGLASALLWSGRAEFGPTRAARFEIPLPEGSRLADAPAISPDGTRIVYVARDGNGKDRLYQRLIDQTVPTMIAAAHGGRRWRKAPVLLARWALVGVLHDGGHEEDAAARRPIESALAEPPLASHQLRRVLGRRRDHRLQSVGLFRVATGLGQRRPGRHVDDA